jgi:hypothetical protein
LVAHSTVEREAGGEHAGVGVSEGRIIGDGDALAVGLVVGVPYEADAWTNAGSIATVRTASMMRKTGRIRRGLMGGLTV